MKENLSTVPDATSPAMLMPGISRIAVAMGIFDGVHLGHQAIMSRLLQLAKDTNAVPVALFFAPHPREVLSGNPPETLTSPEQKVFLLRKFGAEKIVCVPFTRELAALSPEEFLKHFFIAKGLTTTGFCVGSNWRFGRNNCGDTAVLAKWSSEHGIACECVPQVCHNDMAISSTRIRSDIKSGNLAEAEFMLGRPFAITGDVRHGNGIASSKLSCPTANIFEPHQAMPPFGVYAARAFWEDHCADGIAYIGKAPTIRSDSTPILEIHLFDANEDLYGKTLKVEFHAFLRESIKFPSAEALETQIQLDIAEAKKHLQHL